MCIREGHIIVWWKKHSEMNHKSLPFEIAFLNLNVRNIENKWHTFMIMIVKNNKKNTQHKANEHVTWAQEIKDITYQNLKRP